MTKKSKRKQPDAEEILARPWCYYCERDFDDLKILISHQKARHFKCERCGRRLNTAGGLAVHMTQVHKEQLQRVENAIEGRESVDIEIFGMEGIPETEIAAHRQRVLSQISQAEAERRAQAGIPGTGKKAKVTAEALDPEEIKRRLEAHKRAVAEGSVTPGLTPGAHGGSASPGRSQSPGQYGAAAPPTVAATGAYPPQAYPAAQMSYPPTTPAGYPQQVYPAAPYYSAYQTQQTLPYGSAAPAVPQVAEYSGFAGANQGFNGTPPNTAHPHQAPYASPTPQQQQPLPGYPTPQQPQHQQYPHHPQQHRQSPAQTHTNGSLPKPNQVPGLPPKPNIPGLPPKPAFVASGPPAAWGQNLHGAHHSGAPQQHQYQQGGNFALQPVGQQNGASHVTIPQAQIPPPPISTQSTFNGITAPPNTAVPQTPGASNTGAPDAESKKDKLPAKLVYTEDKLSPEQKRARLPRYAAYYMFTGGSNGVSVTTANAANPAPRA